MNSEGVLISNINKKEEDDKGEDDTPQPKPEIANAPALESIPFQTDSSKLRYDSQYKQLVKWLQGVDPKMIDSIILIGHAETDTEYVTKTGTPVNKLTYDPGSNNHLYFTKKIGATKEDEGKVVRTIYTERELADLRFILSLERAKAVATGLLKDASVTKKLRPLINDQPYPRFRIYAAGTQYGKTLGGREKSRIVQIVVTMKGGNITNTESIGNFSDIVGKEKKSENATLTSISSLIKRLGYNVRKLSLAYMYRTKPIMTPIQPSYNQMMDISNAKGAVAAYRRFKSRFI
jgi:outer membrane protein OmpA-like peptidoglycan-associated protein